MDTTEAVPVMGIHLYKDGPFTVVKAEIGGVWIEVIRVRSNSEFSHIVEPAGMWSGYYAMPSST
jgi:hypothetical protein